MTQFSLFPVHLSEIDEWGREIYIIGNKKYQINSTDRSYRQFGVCMICGENPFDVWMMKMIIIHDDWEESYKYKFGHKECLMKEMK